MDENVWYKCVPKDEDVMRGEHPIIYVEETSHSIVEQSMEHWSSYRGGEEENHMVTHQKLVYEGTQAVVVKGMVKKGAKGRKRTESSKGAPKKRRHKLWRGDWEGPLPR